jgi:biopolymer transport protein ExbB
MISNTLLHEVAIDLIYGSIVLATFVVLERLVYLAVLNLSAGRIGRAVKRVRPVELHNQAELAGRDVLSVAVAEYAAAQADPTSSRGRSEDLSAALFIRVDGRVNARLWILDTIVTAAPLLGLLGTILGIMDTFSALATSGISDPGAVSRGIGLALFATAVGIGTALYALVCHNLLHRTAESLTERFKGFLLQASA